MKLEGSLEAFGLPDLFSLLRMTGKTGTLHLRRPVPPGQQVAAVHLTGGRVTGATPDTGRQALARRLVGAGVVDDDALSAAVQAAEERSVGVARALVEAGAVDPDTVRALAEEQARDAVFDVLRWSGGEFTFLVDEQDPDDVGASLDTEQLVVDARTRLERWAEVSAVVPSPQAVPTLAAAPSSDATVTPAEWALLALLDGRRTVADTVALTGRGEFAVVDALAALVRRGLVVVDGSGADAGVATLARRQGLLARLESSAGPSAAEAAPEPAEPPSPAPSNGAAGPGTGRGPTGPGSTSAQTVATPPVPVPSAPVPMPVRAEAEARPAATASSEPRGFADRHGGRPVTPARPEIVPPRTPDHPEPMPLTAVPDVHPVDGSAARKPDPEADVYAFDPAITKTMLMRLIAGVRAL